MEFLVLKGKRCRLVSKTPIQGKHGIWGYIYIGIDLVSGKEIKDAFDKYRCPKIKIEAKNNDINI